jgi:hypothetical protein
MRSEPPKSAIERILTVRATDAKPPGPGENAPGPNKGEKSTFAVHLRNTSAQRNGFQRNGDSCCKSPVIDGNTQPAVVSAASCTESFEVEKRDKYRVNVCLTEAQFRWLESLARRARIKPGAKAYHILADVYEGKLVPAPEPKEVAA